MKKLTDPRELFLELGIETEYDCGILFGRQFRYLEYSGQVQIGDNNFDRWANSVELTFDIWLEKGRRQFLRWFKDAKETTTANA
jgi:hypothetical protein